MWKYNIHIIMIMRLRGAAGKGRTKIFILANFGVVLIIHLMLKRLVCYHKYRLDTYLNPFPECLVMSSYDTCTSSSQDTVMNIRF